MRTMELQLDEETFERARRLATTRHDSLESLIGEVIKRLDLVEMKSDPRLGMFADEPEVLDQVVESAMMARELHPLRPTSSQRQH